MSTHRVAEKGITVNGNYMITKDTEGLDAYISENLSNLENNMKKFGFDITLIKRDTLTNPYNMVMEFELPFLKESMFLEVTYFSNKKTKNSAQEFFLFTGDNHMSKSQANCILYYLMHLASGEDIEELNDMNTLAKSILSGKEIAEDDLRIQKVGSMYGR